MSVSVGYGDWNQIQTYDADLDINDSGGSYGPAGVTYGRFNCQNWATFALVITPIVGALDIAIRYYSTETTASILLSRELWADNVNLAQLAAFFPNMAPWMDVNVNLVGGGNFQLNAFGWRSNRFLPSVYVPAGQFLVNTGSITINAGVTRTINPSFHWAGAVGYRIATNAHTATLTVATYNGGNYVTLHTETVAAGASNDGLLDLSEGITRWQIANTGAANDTYSLNVWPVFLAQR